MVKKTKKVEKNSDLVNITISKEKWKGNEEEVVTITQDKQEIKFSLSKFKQVYGGYILNL